MHNLIWGSSYTCPNGNNLWDALTGSEFSLMNDGSPTFHSASYHTNSTIDLTIVHSSIALGMSWQVNVDPWGSDHCPIIIHSFLKPDLLEKYRRPPRPYSVRTD